jgi:hypothetical protein
MFHPSIKKENLINIEDNSKDTKKDIKNRPQHLLHTGKRRNLKNKGKNVKRENKLHNVQGDL